MTREIKYMSVQEFREGGYLQYANQYLHALGIALSVNVDEEGVATSFGGIWDDRDDPEGIYFSDGLDKEKAEKVAAELEAKSESRKAKLGFVVQPADWEPFDVSSFVKDNEAQITTHIIAGQGELVRGEGETLDEVLGKLNEED